MMFLSDIVELQNLIRLIVRIFFFDFQLCIQVALYILSLYRLQPIIAKMLSMEFLKLFLLEITKKHSAQILIQRKRPGGGTWIDQHLKWSCHLEDLRKKEI